MNDERTNDARGVPRSVFAVIPAAGKSTRMGRPKLALPLGSRTVLERVVTSLRQAGVEHVVVVIGPHVPELGPVAERAGAHVCRLAYETPDMRATIEQGLCWLEEHFHPHPESGWLLVPADHPLLDAQVVRQLVEARAVAGDSSILIPTYQGRRGHPALIGWNHVPAIEALSPGQGLNVYLRQHNEETFEVPVDTEAILWDLDDAADYERLQRAAQSEQP
jgi:molybdenum cofactor cytidylyltransferase